VNRQDAHVSNQCFNLIIGVFYMFRTSYVHHQEDHSAHAALYGVQAGCQDEGCAR